VPTPSESGIIDLRNLNSLRFFAELLRQGKLLVDPNQVVELLERHQRVFITQRGAVVPAKNLIRTVRVADRAGL
jgi:hypothetical protein